MSYETIIYEKEGGIATLTFNRPHVRNAQNYQMGAEMIAAAEEAKGDDDVKVLIVTGAGSAFHAGIDLKGVFLAEDRAKRKAEEKLARLKGISGPMRFEGFYKPIIAAVNGPATAAGFSVAIACDIRIASENAKFGYSYVLRGLAGGFEGMLLLPHIVGLPRAMEMMFSGELIDAAEALRIGLVSKVVPQDRLMEEARGLANKLMNGAPVAQQVIKQAVYKAMQNPASLADFMAPTAHALQETEDHLEGARAFTEKRKPIYKGR
ncbi:enoyl-CoA hydratase/isomerase family protein [Chloroflexota bacterium]